MRALLTIIMMLMTLGIHAQSFIPGYENMIKGESIPYHSPQEDAGEALLVRSEDAANYIEWCTAPVPIAEKGARINFMVMMALDVNPEDPHSWDVFFNDRQLFQISSPMDTLNKVIEIEGEMNSSFSFTSTRVDKYGDLIGYAKFSIPRELMSANENNRFKVVGENGGSRTWFIVYKYKMIPSFHIQAENAIRKGEMANERVVKLEIVNYKEGARAEIMLGAHRETRKLDFGYNRTFVSFTPEETSLVLPYTLHVDGELCKEGKLSLDPVQPMTIYLIHHSHVDIGYTHVQSEVEEKQWSYIEQCIDLAGKSESFPEEARFKWNIEVMWALDSYWKKASPEKKERLKQAIKKGWIELDAFYGNELTGLCTSEELVYLMSSALEIANECGVELKSAMISDIPGWTWGIVPVLADAGVEYLSLGTNTFHRIGYTIEDWGDKPFYWESASGNDKVLTWIHGKGYSSFHTGLGAENVVNKLDEQILLSYMNELSAHEYPYNKVILRYNIGSDNGPPDVRLSEKVQNWNDRYESPRLIISTVSKAFGAFEQSYGESLPVVKGDFTGYWEDGAASSASETSLNRKAAHKLNQAQTLFSMSGVTYPKEKIDDAWQKVMLYDEHTWGSWNSISEPHADFTKHQWAVKQAFALDGFKAASELESMALDERQKTGSRFVEVINTHSWPVRDVIKIPAQDAKGYNQVADKSGKILKSQLLSDGSIVFIPEPVPSLSSALFELKIRKKKADTAVPLVKNEIDNHYFRISLDEGDGTLKEIFWKAQEINLVDEGRFSGLNQYIYVKGRYPSNKYSAADPIISLEEYGDVLISLKVDYRNVPGSRSLVQRYTLYNNLERIDIVNETDKEEIYSQEGVHFTFPFQIPEGRVLYDLAYATAQPNLNQIKGSNKNFISIENWVDISNEKYGITWISKDAPLIEIGDIHNDPTVSGYLRELSSTQTILSYVMNNYWETNYLAAQGGKVKFQYSVLPHEGFKTAWAEKRALEIQQPLLVIPVKESEKPMRFPFSLESENLIIQSIIPHKDNYYLLRIFNAGQKTEQLKWSKLPENVYRTDLLGRKKSTWRNKEAIAPMDFITLLVK